MASSKCCDNPPQLKPRWREGKVIDSFGGLKAYVVGSDDCKAAVVLVSDVYDFLHGDPYMPGKTDRSLPVSVWVASHDPVSHFVKIFPGVRHGWSVRYRDHDTAALKNAEEALVDMMDWFHKNLKLTLKLMSSM
ncbi:hypothetical protein PR202_ga04582 [Eleusine coracana subsp. coracana]|uniref:Dienelactone hydrolase domain-containing protein n=1 Tax=Eleusine coracana subsp. coracana TaxID=191504 RepID=A0AAV5BRC9_ELECO|nr:hypothetical protein PR202_ga04582 [Eleusine coracana subsp. coracana]